MSGIVFEDEEPSAFQQLADEIMRPATERAAARSGPRPGIRFEEDVPTGATSTDLARFMDLAQRRAKILEKVAWYEEKLKAAKEELKAIEEVEFIEAFDACGLHEIKLADGTKIGVKDIVAGSIPAKNQQEAFAWLRENGHGGLIKHVLNVSVPKGLDKLNDQAVAYLTKLGLEVVDKETVHAQTLGAWARELLAEGESIPLELLGIYVGRRATVIK